MWSLEAELAYKIRVALLEKEVDVSFGTSKATWNRPRRLSSEYLKSRLEIEGAACSTVCGGTGLTRCGIPAALHPMKCSPSSTCIGRGKRRSESNCAPASDPSSSRSCLRGDRRFVRPRRYRNPTASYFQWSKARNGRAAPLFQVSEQRSGEEWVLHDGRTLRTRYAVNAAGLFADEVSRCFGAESFEISARKGEYFLLDRLAPCRPERVVFPVPSSVSKGMLVIPTVEGTTLIGPTADIVDDKTDVSTSRKAAPFVSFFVPLCLSGT